MIAMGKPTTYAPMTGPAPLGTSLTCVTGHPMARWYCAVSANHVVPYPRLVHDEDACDIWNGVTIIVDGAK